MGEGDRGGGDFAARHLGNIGGEGGANGGAAGVRSGWGVLCGEGEVGLSTVDRFAFQNSFNMFGTGVKDLETIGGTSWGPQKILVGKCGRGLTGATLAGLDARIGLRIRVRTQNGMLNIGEWMLSLNFRSRPPFVYSMPSQSRSLTSRLIITVFRDQRGKPNRCLIKRKPGALNLTRYDTRKYFWFPLSDSLIKPLLERSISQGQVGGFVWMWLSNPDSLLVGDDMTFQLSSDEVIALAAEVRQLSLGRELGASE
jgi:hypothetical protein